MIDFELDKQSFIPFYRQIIDLILAGISSGAVMPGEQLPTIRDLAVKLEVNPNTVVKAYSQLQLLGVLDTQQGSGVFVGEKVQREVPPDETQRAVEELCRGLVSRAQLMNIGIEQIIECLQRIRAQSPKA
jgi:GntR family transcriptional regulator